jgi:exodeoxyribonuclease VIII
MLDLETLGTNPGAVITQIGVSAFNSRVGAADLNVPDPFKLIHVAPQSALDLGMHVSWDTIAWWLTQNEEARIAMASKMPRWSLPDALKTLDEWIGHYCSPRFNIWGNGSNFDVVLLEDAYRRVKRKPVWDFRNIRDMRTIVDLCPSDLKVKPEVAHNAAADAKAQALTVQNCYSWLGARGKTQG